MIQLFIGLTLVNLLCLGVTTWLGYSSLNTAGQSKPVHILAGALATLVCCGVHCVVFTYFIATAKWVQHAVRVKHLDESFIAPTRSFKVQAFPAALLAMGIVFVAAVLGAARDNYAIPRLWHHSAALSALVINAVVALVELVAIRRNGLLIERVLAVIANPTQRVSSRSGLTMAGVQATIPPASPVIQPTSAQPPPP